MMKIVYIMFSIIIFCGSLPAQNMVPDSVKTIHLKEIIITANRFPLKLLENPGAVSLVTSEELSRMPKGIAMEEALRLVPGVRIDNQHNGERIHVSIRGQGILTERGLRGIGVIVDGIPLNDPSGFAPDLFDVDWSTVRKIEVLRGPEAGIYGGGGAAGVIDILTNDGGPNPVGGELLQIVGSNGFSKSLLQLDGTQDVVDYRVSYSRTDGNGYRDHQAFWSNKLYEKINFHPTDKLAVTQIISHTDYFHQNPEGLNIGQFDNLRQANPDARPFNEYQKTNRTTAGFHSRYKPGVIHDIEAGAYLHLTDYKETSNKYAEYRDINNPGANIQYNLYLNLGEIKNNISFGTDLKWQSMTIFRLQSASDPQREESIDETNLETDSLLANEIISQQSRGVFLLYHFNFGHLNLLANIRYDAMENELTNKLMSPDSAHTTKNFSKASVRVGASYDFSDAFILYANWSQGFMPPSTEELASNPVGYSGFNTHLIPAVSDCYELGTRGFPADKLHYEITGFIMYTENDFFRFKQSGRGNQEVFYGNAGNSRRFGLEAFLSVNLLKHLGLEIAYTYSDFRYVSAEIDPVYTDSTYVLTSPPAAGQWLPNSPRHQLYAEMAYEPFKHLKVSLATEYQSKWAIYTDAAAYNGEPDPLIYRNWQKGFNLYHARIAYQWTISKFNGELSFFIRNLTGESYMAFTEPDPDGNSYQPGPGREFFGALKIRF